MEEKEWEILQAASKEFGKTGYFKTKTEDIANTAGVSKGLLFHYFKSKKNLYSETVRLAISTLEELFDYTQFPKSNLTDLFEFSLKKKFEISKAYEAEMTLMMEVYSHLDKLPGTLQQEIGDYVSKMRMNSYEIIAQIIRDLPMKEHIQEEDVVKIILTMFTQIEEEAKEQMRTMDEFSMDLFDELIVSAKRQINILEVGFLK